MLTTARLTSSHSGDQAPWARRKASLAMQKTQKKAVVEMQALTENH